MGVLLTLDEVADYLGVPKATLYAWRRYGSGVPMIKVGRHLRVDPAVLKAWLDAHTSVASGDERQAAAG